MGDFTGYGFVAGTTAGFRSFRVDRLGRLTGVHHREVWRPGENQAKCKAFSIVGMQRLINRVAAVAAVNDPQSLLAVPAVGHDPADCECGFYAYYHPDHNQYAGDYQGDPLVQGVVEGYGKTVIGSKGFRAQKARIVGLVAPQPATVPELPKVKVDWGRLFFASFISAWCAAVVAAIVGMFAAPDASYGTASLILAASAVAGAMLPLAWTGFDVWRARHLRLVDGSFGRYLAPPFDLLPRTRTVRRAIKTRANYERAAGAAKKGGTIDFDQVRRNYPNIPIYDTVDQLLAAHPLDKTQPAINLTPDTDPQFWDRPAE